jgi:hypothetical protein
MSAILELGPPAVDAVSLTEALAFLRITNPNGPDSALIQSAWIPAARRYIEGMTGLVLAQRKFAQYEERFPLTVWPFAFDQARVPVVNRRDQRLSLLRSPLASVQKIVYVGTDGNLHGMLPGQDFAVDYASRPGKITPLPGQDWPALLLGQFWPELFFPNEFWAPSINGLNRVQIFFTAGFTALATDTASETIGAQWQPYEVFPQYSYIIDGSGNMQIQMAPGSPLSGSDVPTYAAVGHTIASPDGGCSWFNAGPAGVSTAVDDDDTGNVDSDTAIAPPAYQTGHVYPGPSLVLDSNGNIEFTQNGLTSGGSAPAWPASNAPLGTVTADNGGSWLFLGAPQDPGPEFSAAPGGTTPGPNQLVQYQAASGIPEDLKLAVLLMLSHFYYNREPVVEGREGKVADVPHSVSQICSNYRVWDFGSGASSTVLG